MVIQHTEAPHAPARTRMSQPELSTNVALFLLTRFWFSRCVDDTKNSLSISRGALAPGSYRLRQEPGASAPRLMNNPAQPENKPLALGEVAVWAAGEGSWQTL